MGQRTDVQPRTGLDTWTSRSESGRIPQVGRTTAVPPLKISSEKLLFTEGTTKTEKPRIGKLAAMKNSEIPFENVKAGPVHSNDSDDDISFQELELEDLGTP